MTGHTDVQINIPPRFITGPSGELIPVPNGMSIEEATEVVRKRLMCDRNVQAEVMRRNQITRGNEPSPDPADPEFRRAHLAKQSTGPVVQGDIENFMVRADLAQTRGPNTGSKKLIK